MGHLLACSQSELKTMDFSSLKKMSEVHGRKEGNYASLEKTPLGRFTNCDLGLTLLPGSQIQRKDEERLSGATESSPMKLGSKNVTRTGQQKPIEPVREPDYVVPETESPNKAQSPSSSSDIGPESANLSHVTIPSNREPLISHYNSAKDGNNVVQHNVGSSGEAPCGEQSMGTGEIGTANNCHYDHCSLCATKRRKFESRTLHEMRESTAGKGKEVTLRNHDKRSFTRHYQDLPEISAVRSGKRKALVATIRAPFSGSGEGLRSSKPERNRPTSPSQGTALARSHQSRTSESEETTLYGCPSVSGSLVSKSPAKQLSESEKLKVHYRSPNSLKGISTQHRKHSSLYHGNPVDERTRVLKPRKGVNHSWTSHFPAMAKTPRRANPPASFWLATPFTSSENHQHPNQKKSLSTSTNIHACTHFSSTNPSPLLPRCLGLSKAFNHPLDTRVSEDLLDTPPISNQRPLARRRFASMPNLSSTCEPKNMNPPSSFGPASMPTPPREQANTPSRLPSSSSLSHYENAPFRRNLTGPPRGHIGMSINADDSSLQNGQFQSSFKRQYENSFSERQDIGFTSGLHSCHNMTQPSDHDDVTGSFASMDGAIAANRPQYSRRRLEVKPYYSHEEVKSLMYDFVSQKQTVEAENAKLHSYNTAMTKGFESLQNAKADLAQQIQYYERTVAQKDLQIEAMQRHKSSLHQQYTQICHEYSYLLATIRSEDGTGNPSAIAKKIRLNHSPNVFGADSQGRQPSANASPMRCANAAQIPILKTPKAFQVPVPPVSVPGSSEAHGANASSRSFRQQGYPAANHNTAYPLQTVSIPVNLETNIATASSQALTQPGSTAANHHDAKSPQSVSIPDNPEANLVNHSSRASVQTVVAAVTDRNSANSPHDGSTEWAPSNRQLGTVIKIMSTGVQSNNCPTGQVLTEHVTIDLTDDDHSPSSSASRNTSVRQTPQPAIQGRYSPKSLPPCQTPFAQYPAGQFVSSQFPSSSFAHNQTSQSPLTHDQASQDKNLEAMQIQKEAFARMAEKPLSWLQGENPFRTGTTTEQRAGLPNQRRPSENNAEEYANLAQSPKADSVAPVAPLPETATGPKTKRKASKTKVVLDAEARKERAKIYRKTAAEKKKLEKELAKQRLQDETTSDTAIRAQKQDRRATKGRLRQMQARKPWEEAGPCERQKTLDGRLYQADTGVQPAMHEGGMEEAALDDHDSLFGDDEDNEMENEESEDSPGADIVMGDDSAAAKEDVDPAYVAELEAVLEAEADAGMTTGVKQDDAVGGDHGLHDFSSESEESEEE